MKIEDFLIILIALDTNFKITMTEYKQGKNVLEIKENLEWMLGQFSKKVAVKNEKL